MYPPPHWGALTHLISTHHNSYITAKITGHYNTSMRGPYTCPKNKLQPITTSDASYICFDLFFTYVLIDLNASKSVTDTSYIQIQPKYNPLTFVLTLALYLSLLCLQGPAFRPPRNLGHSNETQRAVQPGAGSPLLSQQLLFPHCPQLSSDKTNPFGQVQEHITGIR